MAPMVAGMFLTLTAEDWSNHSYLVVTNPLKGWLLAVK